MCSTTFLKQKFGNAFLNMYCTVGKEIFINFTCGLEKKTAVILVMFYCC